MQPKELSSDGSMEEMNFLEEESPIISAMELPETKLPTKIHKVKQRNKAPEVQRVQQRIQSLETQSSKSTIKRPHS